MKQYAIFLRGINVGGIKILMTDLKQCLETAGLTNITTTLQTGNILCTSPKTATAIKAEVETALTNTFHYDAYVLVYEQTELIKLIQAYPFDRTQSHQHHYIVLTADQADTVALLRESPDLDKAVEEIAPGKGAIYWRVLKGMTVKSDFGKLLSKRQYKSITTTRNINTLEKMVSAAQP